MSMIKFQFSSLIVISGLWGASSTKGGTVSLEILGTGGRFFAGGEWDQTRSAVTFYTKVRRSIAAGAATLVYFLSSSDYCIVFCFRLS